MTDRDYNTSTGVSQLPQYGMFFRNRIYYPRTIHVSHYTLSYMYVSHLFGMLEDKLVTTHRKECTNL